MPNCELLDSISLDAYYAALESRARKVAPHGTDFRAVVDQWLHALAYEFECYGARSKSSKAALRKAIDESALKSSSRALSQLLRKNTVIRQNRQTAFSFIDLFAGVGGMRLGFQAAGGRCVFSSEWDRHAQETYKQNHGELPFGDITKVPPDAIPDHDVLLAGFPCQPFSHAGKKLGIEDTRGTLFYDIAQILKAKQPRFALLENVRGLISHRGGETLRVILRALTSIGYECNIPSESIERDAPSVVRDEAKRLVLRSHDFGVPQQRHRLYLVLWRKGLIDRFAYPRPLRMATKVGSILESKPDPRFRLSDRLWEGHQRRKRENELKGEGFGFGLVTPESAYTNTISARYYKDGSEILIRDESSRNPRKLTPREAARLQGFPEAFKIHASSVQSYRQFGNSVSVPVVAAIAKEIAACLRLKGRP